MNLGYDVSAVKHWKKVAAAALLLLLIGAVSWRLGAKAKPKTVPPSFRPTEANDLLGMPALQYAAKRYAARGAKYIWGVNDCSVFVSDYLSKQKRPPKSRLTTWNLDRADVAPFGLTVEGSPKPGDVLNYRYWSKKNKEMAGHCGVVIKKPDGLWVVHNCVTIGLATQRLSGFFATAQYLGVSKMDVAILRPLK